MNFERGISPKKALGIGMESMIKEINGVILKKKDFNKRFQDIIKSIQDLSQGSLPLNFIQNLTKIRCSSVVIFIINGEYKIIKNQHYLPSHLEEGKLKNLPFVIKKLKKNYLYLKNTNIIRF